MHDIPADHPDIALETARLRLRSLREDDLANLIALIDNWEVARWVSRVPHPSAKRMGESGLLSFGKTMRRAGRGALGLH